VRHQIIPQAMNPDEPGFMTDDPQKHEDEHVKEVKKRTESQGSNGR
jgi:hypothetical protein